MQATHDGDAYPLPCNKTLFMAQVMEINNPAILIRLEQATSIIIEKKCDNRRAQKT